MTHVTIVEAILAPVRTGPLFARERNRWKRCASARTVYDCDSRCIHIWWSLCWSHDAYIIMTDIIRIHIVFLHHYDRNHTNLHVLLHRHARNHFTNKRACADVRQTWFDCMRVFAALGQTSYAVVVLCIFSFAKKSKFFINVSVCPRMRCVNNRMFFVCAAFGQTVWEWLVCNR